jgi:hypothetical protein
MSCHWYKHPHGLLHWSYQRVNCFFQIRSLLCTCILAWSTVELFESFQSMLKSTVTISKILWTDQTLLMSKLLWTGWVFLSRKCCQHATLLHFIYAKKAINKEHKCAKVPLDILRYYLRQRFVNKRDAKQNIPLMWVWSWNSVMCS